MVCDIDLCRDAYDDNLYKSYCISQNVKPHDFDFR